MDSTTNYKYGGYEPDEDVVRVSMQDDSFRIFIYYCVAYVIFIISSYILGCILYIRCGRRTIKRGFILLENNSAQLNEARGKPRPISSQHLPPIHAGYQHILPMSQQNQRQQIRMPTQHVLTAQGGCRQISSQHLPPIHAGYQHLPPMSQPIQTLTREAQGQQIRMTTQHALTAQGGCQQVSSVEQPMQHLARAYQLY